MTNRMYKLLCYTAFISEYRDIRAFSPPPHGGARQSQQEPSRLSTILRASGGDKGPDDFFSLYDEEELRKVLNIHRQLTNDESDEAVPAERCANVHPRISHEGSRRRHYEKSTGTPRITKDGRN